MQYRIAIAEYRDGPKAAFGLRIAAQRLAFDEVRLFGRITGRKLNYDGAMPILLRPKHRDTGQWMTALQGVGAGAVRNSSDGWWNIKLALEAAGYDTEHTIWSVTHLNRLGDVTGIGQPTGQHLWNWDADPTVGGISTNGGGQLQQALNAAFVGRDYAYVRAYRGHEDGHALGLHHTGWLEDGLSPADRSVILQSIMSYGYGAMALGTGLRELNPDGTPKLDDQGREIPEYMNPKLVTPMQAEVLMRHEAFSDMPMRSEGFFLGAADSMVNVIGDDQRRIIGGLGDTAYRNDGVILWVASEERSNAILGAASGEYGK